MTEALDLADAVIAAWKTSNRVTLFFFENLPSELGPAKVSGTSLRTVRTIAGHIHNARCMWIKMLGRRHGIRVPKRVSLHTVTREDLLPALERSSRGIVELLELGISHGGKIPATGVAWLNLPVDVVHVSPRGASPRPSRVACATDGSSATYRDNRRAVAVVQAGKEAQAHRG